jgi:hypothetical protein
LNEVKLTPLAFILWLLFASIGYVLDGPRGAAIGLAVITTWQGIMFLYMATRD